MSRRNQLGFTLPELLVALAIFISVMGGVGLLLVNGLRVMRQGFQNQEVFEQSRNTLKIIERDLSRAFTSRDYGDYYNFYGTPIGFSFVGVVAPAATSNEVNLSRVTYVIWHPPTGADIQEPVDVDQVGFKNTYRLLRFVEPGAKSLDDLPVQWDEFPLNPTPDSAGFGTTLGDLVQTVVINYENRRLSQIANGVPCQPLLPGELENVEHAVKRELWIRLLSGGDNVIPDGWAMQDVFGSNGLPVIQLGGVAEDYIVSENILYNYFNKTDPNPANHIDQDLEYLPFIDPDAGIQVNYNDLVTLNFPAYFFTYQDIRPGVDQITGQETVNALTVRYWNDLRNFEIPSSLCDEDGDGLVDEAFFEYEIQGNLIDDDGDGLIDEPPAVTSAVGSPNNPNLPQEVATFFTLFFESPYPNVPDFRRRFDQRIDLPTGYRRLKLSE